MLNCMRIPVIKQLKLEDLEFSQNYLFFWDKVLIHVLFTLDCSSDLDFDFLCNILVLMLSLRLLCVNQCFSLMKAEIGID